MTQAAVDALREFVRATVRREIREAIRDVQTEIPDLDARIRRAVSEKVRALYKGVWSAHVTYLRGDMVSRAGSVWVLTGSASKGHKPGVGETEWQLAVKRGRDGRDAKE